MEGRRKDRHRNLAGDVMNMFNDARNERLEGDIPRIAQSA